MSTSAQIRETVYETLVIAWNAAYGAPPLEVKIALDNETFIPPPGFNKPWARAVIRQIKSAQETLGAKGNRRFKRDCDLVVQIFLVPDTGTKLADQFVQTIRDTFEGNSLNGANFNQVSMREIGNLGAWFQANITASFWFEEII